MYCFSNVFVSDISDGKSPFHLINRSCHAAFLIESLRDIVVVELTNDTRWESLHLNCNIN